MFSKSLNSLLKITQSISICLFFLQIHYNKYIAKIICFIGPLAFSIYLIHNNKIARDNLLRKALINQPKNISLNSVLVQNIIRKEKEQTKLTLRKNYLFDILLSKRKINFQEETDSKIGSEYLLDENDFSISEDLKIDLNLFFKNVIILFNNFIIIFNYSLISPC